MNRSLRQVSRRVRALAVAGLALLPTVGSVTLAGAQPGARGPAVIGTQPSPPQKYVCGEEFGSKLCQCTGAADCVDMKNGGQCTDAIVTLTKSMGQCSWKGPPSQQPTAYTPRPSRGPATLAGAPNPQPYGCKYKGDTVLGCSCKDLMDCLKLDDTKLCGAHPIVDVDPGKGSGKCGSY